MDPRLVLGETAYPVLGRQGLEECLLSIFKSLPGQSSATSSSSGGGSDDDEDTEPVGVVVVRPPETFCIIKGTGPVLYFRDSHRRAQLDFANLVSQPREGVGACCFFLANA